MSASWLSRADVVAFCTTLISAHNAWVGLNHIYTVYIRYFGREIFGKEITKYRVIYSVYLQFKPTLHNTLDTSGTHFLASI